MAVFKTTPVYFCKRCGRPLRLQGMTYNDPLGENLHIVARAAEQMAYCPYHLAERNHYIKQGRLPDWEAGRP